MKVAILVRVFFFLLFSVLYQESVQAMCRQNWTQFEGACYIHSYGQANPHITGALQKEACAKMFGNYAQPLSIHSTRENKFVQSSLISGGTATGSAWIGLVSSKKIRKWAWLDKSSVDYELWSDGQANRYGRCAYMGCCKKWKTQKCKSAKKYYICKYSTTDESSWTQWSNWSACSVTCGRGNKTRMRRCKKQHPKGLGGKCVKNSTGNATETLPCVKPLCTARVIGSVQCKQYWKPCGEACCRLFRDVDIQGHLVPEKCAAWGATGASVLSQEENTFLKRELQKWRGNTSVTHAWIGLRRSLPQGSWKWDDGTPFSPDTYINWNNTFSTHGCVKMNQDSGKWSTGHCRGTLGDRAFYFCKYRPRVCRIGWTKFEEACYIHSYGDIKHMRIKGSQVQKSCVEKFGKYAQPISIHSARENDFVQHVLLKDKPGTTWLGLSSLQGKKWGWTDNSSLDFVKWEDEEPPTHGHCAYIRGVGRWRAQHCAENNKHYICKYWVTDDGSWSEWSDWNTCSVSCGRGKRERMRSCTNPVPRRLGKKCGNDSKKIGRNEKGSCAMTLCPVHGGWSNWTEWSTCSKTCGQAERVRNRTCTRPVPQHGGDDCKKGPHGLGGAQEETCDNHPCPLWQSWSAWNLCSKSCGKGSKVRQRSCLPPGYNCTVDSSGIEGLQTRVCNNFPCPVDGKWAPWGQWTTCSMTCGGGRQTRLRTCTNPAAKHGGKKCEGGSLQRNVIICNTEKCSERTAADKDSFLLNLMVNDKMLWILAGVAFLLLLVILILLYCRIKNIIASRREAREEKKHQKKLREYYKATLYDQGGGNSF